MTTKQQNIETSKETSDWYKENFPTARQGMSLAVDSFFDTMKDNPVAEMFQGKDSAHLFMMGIWKQMWQHSLAGIKGMFSGPELSLIIDIYNGTMLSPYHYGSNSLAVGISDSIALDGMAEKWEIDPASLLGKVKGLTPAQAICLEIWANGFWYGQKPEGGRDFEKYVAQLT